MAFERISLNIIPEGEMPVFHASQFDAGRPIIIDLYNGEDAYTPAAGVTFELHCRKVDDNIVTLDTYEVDGNTLTFSSTEQLCACSGDNLCEIAILLDELVMGTLNFILHVERDPIAGGCTSETSIYNLQQQIDDIITGEGYVKDTDLEVLQSDWNETDETSPAYIKNKPGPALHDQADWTENDPSAQSYIKHKPDLKTVATSGSYNDLTDKPTIPAAQVNSDWNASSGVAEILNKPTIPTKTSDLTNDSGFVESTDLATVATTGDYDDLLNKPTIPAAQVNSDWNSNSGVSQILNKPWVPVYTENETPYQIRTAPAGNNRTLEKLIGVSCAFNQLVDSGDTSINTTSGHKYLTKINNVWSIIAGGSAVTIVDDSSDMVIDLTSCFGSEVADYLYNSADGISIFRSLFADNYYAFQTATLISSKPTSKVVVGKNLCNANAPITLSGEGMTAKQPCVITIAGTYTMSLTSNTNIAFAMYTYDSNDTLLETFTSMGASTGRTHLTINITKTCATIAFYINAATTITDIQVEFGSTMTAYEPYTETTYPLGGDELRGLLKVVDGQLVAYGDVKPSDGNGTEVFDIVDLGSLNWSYSTTDASNPLFYAYISGATDVVNCICADYVKGSGIYSSDDKTWTWANYHGSKEINIIDLNYTDAQTFKAAMSGVYLIYEKATPTAKSYTPFTNPMLCGSTEEFTDSRSLKMFCGHDSLYYNSPFKGW